MHDGVFEGEKAKAQLVKILILGESHYWSENKKEEDTVRRIRSDGMLGRNQHKEYLGIY